MNRTAAAGVYKKPRTTVGHDQGSFRTFFEFPGRNLPGHDDHGYGPLATVVESFMDPGTLIPMHGHRNEEIVSWVPEGVMRHDDETGNELVTDRENLLVMNAGAGFRHEERTLASDPPLRMLQIFVRPTELGLPATVQHEPLPAPVVGTWRHVFGPEGGDAPAYVRNAVDCFDVRLDAGDRIELPMIPGRDAFCYVFEGAVTLDPGVAVDGDADAVHLGRTETALIVGGGDVTDDGAAADADDDSNGGATATLTAEEAAIVVVFRIDPDAPITRQGTIGR